MGRKSKLDKAYDELQKARKLALWQDDDPRVIEARRLYDLEWRKRHGHTGDFYRGKGYSRRRRPALLSFDGGETFDGGATPSTHRGLLTRFGFYGGMRATRRDHFHDAYLVDGFLCQMARTRTDGGEWVTAFMPVNDATLMERYELPNGATNVQAHVTGGFIDRLTATCGGVALDLDGDAMVLAAQELGLFPEDDEPIQI